MVFWDKIWFGLFLIEEFHEKNYLPGFDHCGNGPSMLWRIILPTEGNSGYIVIGCCGNDDRRILCKIFARKYGADRPVGFARGVNGEYRCDTQMRTRQAKPTLQRWIANSL